MPRFLWVLWIVMSMSVGWAQENASELGAEGTDMIVFLGTATGGKSSSRGIYRARLDLASGKLSPLELAVETPSPTFLVIHPDRHYLYAVNQSMEVAGEQIGGVSSFTIDPMTGELRKVNTVAAEGKAPCHITTDALGRAALIASYTSGNVAALPIKPDGSLGAVSSNVQHAGSGPDPKRQGGPHAHSIYPDPTNRYALSCDLGTDQVLIYRLDPAAATLEPHDPPAATLAAGSGPRHLAFHPGAGGKFVYVVTELANTIVALEWNASAGALREIQTVSTLPDGYAEKSFCSEIAVHPNGRFVYAANRGHDSLAVFAVDEGTGRLSPRGHTPIGGKYPRHFAIDPTGRFLIAAHQNSDNLTIFHVNPMTGELKQTDQAIELDAPMCVRFMPPVIE